MYNLIHDDCWVGLAGMDDASVHLVVTSPPYPGVPEMWGDFWSVENFNVAHGWLDRVWGECVRVLVPGGYMAINVGNTGRNPTAQNSSRIQMWGWQNLNKVTPRGEIIWNKQVAVRNRTAWGTWRKPNNWSLEDNHEYICLFRKNGERTAVGEFTTTAEEFIAWRTSEWKIATAKASKVGHVAPFPIEIPHRLIKLCTYPGETVLDPFAGSGTTLIAAELLGRNSIGFEINAERHAHALSYINEQLARAGKADRVTIMQKQKLVQQRIEMKYA